jgi:hypothetical protein
LLVGTLPVADHAGAVRFGAGKVWQRVKGLQGTQDISPDHSPRPLADFVLYNRQIEKRRGFEDKKGQALDGDENGRLRKAHQLLYMYCFFNFHFTFLP